MPRPDLAILPFLLERTAKIKRLAGTPDFRASAYEKAALSLREHSEEIEFRASENTLTDLPSIGKSMAAGILTYMETGEFPPLLEAKKEVPAGLIDWLDLPGLGIKKILTIHKALGIQRLDELEQACADGSLETVKGMAKKSVERLAANLEWKKTQQGFVLPEEAKAFVQTLLAEFTFPKGVRSHLTGDLARDCELVSNAKLLLSGIDEGEADSLQEQIDLLAPAFECRVHRCSFDAFAFERVCLSSSLGHLRYLQAQASKLGLHWSAAGLGYPKDEADVYAALHLPFRALFWREQEWDEQTLPTAPFPLHAVRGVLHAHSTWSDGQNSIEEMARACMSMGYDYLGISDHSQTAAYAGGLKPEAVERQWKEIDLLNQQFRDEGLQFEVLKGIESDILRDGSLDYDTHLLSGFDFVIASLHAQLDLARDVQQARVETAIRNPHTTILGHVTARRLLRRPSCQLDLAALISLAVEEGCVIECNCSEDRMELDWRWGPYAQEQGLSTCISPDAHSIVGLRRLKHGAQLVRKAGFAQAQVLNTRDLSTLKSVLKK